MKIIFLDIDGVLNTDTDFLELRMYGHHINKGVTVLNRGKLALLEALVTRTAAKIVVSSTWRYTFSITDLYSLFKEHGSNITSETFIGDTEHTTIRFSENPQRRRYEEIMNYVKNNGVKDYVILDDCDYLPSSDKRVIKTNEHVGLTYPLMILASTILGLTEEVRKKEEEYFNLASLFI